MAQGQPRQSGRIPELDGVRGIAILSIVYWHYFVCLAVRNTNPIVQFLCRIGGLSWAGVDLFFVLSGFLLGGILLENKKSPNLFTAFYVRRCFRIFPLYFAWLLLFLLLRPAIGHSFPWLMRDPLPVGWYATYTQNFGYALRNRWGDANWLTVTWSLAIEEQFYLLLPLLVFWLGPKSLVAFSAAAILSAPFVRYFLVQTGHGLGAQVLLPARWDDLFLGVLGAFFLSRPDSADKCRRHPMLIQLPLFISFTFCVFWFVKPSIWRWPWLVSLQITLLGTFSLALIFAALFAPWRAIFRARSLIWLGSISYGIYMFHEGVSGLVHASFNHPIPYLYTFGDFGMVILAFALSLTLAQLSFWFFESPLIRFGHRFRYWPANTSSDLISTVIASKDKEGHPD